MTEHEPGASTAWLEVAGWLGNHALAVFGVAMGALLAGTVAAWWAATQLHRGWNAWGRARVAAGAEPIALAPVAIGLAAGFGAIAGGAALFAEVAEGIGSGRRVGELDLAFSDALRASVSIGTQQAFARITRLGDVATLTVLCIGVALALAWRGRRALALAWAASIAGNGVLTRLLKALFERTRPLHDHALANEAGYSFPSGHSSGSILVYGLLAYLALRFLPAAWRLPAVLLAVATAFGVGCSRLFLLVHWPSDVVAGFVAGGTWLVVCVASVEAARRRGARR